MFSKYRNRRSKKAWNEPSSYNQGEAVEDKTVAPCNDKNRVEPLNIDVQKGCRFFLDPLNVYQISSSTRGSALIINNQDFDDVDMFPHREGANVEATNLENLLTQLGFNVITYKNMDRIQITKKMIEFSETAGSKAVDMMLVFILSYGGENGTIISSDGYEVDIETDVLR